MIGSLRKEGGAGGGRAIPMVTTHVNFMICILLVQSLWSCYERCKDGSLGMMCVTHRRVVPSSLFGKHNSETALDSEMEKTACRYESWEMERWLDKVDKCLGRVLNDHVYNHIGHVLGGLG